MTLSSIQKDILTTMSGKMKPSQVEQILFDVGGRHGLSISSVKAAWAKLIRAELIAVHSNPILFEAIHEDNREIAEVS